MCPKLDFNVVLPDIHFKGLVVKVLPEMRWPLTIFSKES